MPNNTVTKHSIFSMLHNILTIFLLFIIGMYFFFRWINTPCPSYTLVTQKQITNKFWLYVLDTDGGALSSDWFRYYLEKKLDGDPIPQLDKKYHPFLITDNGDAKISPLQDLQTNQTDIKIETSGRIFSFKTDDFDSPRIFINTVPKDLR